jgi:hypothetical protein
MQTYAPPQFANCHCFIMNFESLGGRKLQFYLLLVILFLSAATLVAADYGVTSPPTFMSVVCCLFVCLFCLFCVGTDKNCNFSAVRSPIDLKLGGDLGLVTQIYVHDLVSRFDGFLYCKQTNNKKTRRAEYD